MSLFAIILFSLFLFPFSLSFAAVGVDTSDTVFGAGVDEISLTYTVTGSNTLALCGVAINAGSSTLGAVTFNAVPMSLVYGTEPFTNFYYALFSMVGVSGTHDFVLTGSDSGHIGLGCSTFTGVDSGAPLGSYVTAVGPDNITVTVPANGMAADFAGDHPGDCSAGVSPTAGGQTLLYGECAAGDSNTSLRSSYRTTSGDFTWSQYWIQIGVPINPVAAAVSSRRRAIAVQ